MFVKKYLRKIVLLTLVFVILVSNLPTVVHAKTDYKIGVANVKVNELRLRRSNTLVSSVLGHAYKGDYVVVSEKVGKWYKVNYNTKEGYMHEDYLTFEDKENVELGYGNVCGSYVNVRSGPSTSYKAIMTLKRNTKAYIIGINNGWYKIIANDKIGYIRSDYLDLTEIPYENRGSKNSPLFFKDGKLIVSKVDPSMLKSKNDDNNDNTNDSNKSNENAFGEKVVKTAEKYLGVPYVWGGTTPSGFDCSGFVYYVFNQAGYKLSRSMSAQYKTGVSVAKEDLQPGDIVFFQGTYASGMSHEGIYVGDGKFIHAPSTGKTVSYADLNSSYYTAHYYGARRISG